MTIGLNTLGSVAIGEDEVSKHSTRLNVELCTSRNAVLQLALITARTASLSVNILSGTVVVTRKKTELKNVRVATTRLGIQIKTERVMYNASRLTANLLTYREGDAESLVIDIHNPEQPIYGSYA